MIGTGNKKSSFFIRSYANLFHARFYKSSFYIRISTIFCIGPFRLADGPAIKNDAKTTSKSSQNEPQIAPKTTPKTCLKRYSKKSSKMTHFDPQTGPQMHQKCNKSPPKAFQKRLQSGPGPRHVTKRAPRASQDHFWIKNGPKMTPTCPQQAQTMQKKAVVSPALLGYMSHANRYSKH